MLLQWANGTDTQTDIIPLHRPCTHYASSVNDITEHSFQIITLVNNSVKSIITWNKKTGEACCMANTEHVLIGTELDVTYTAGQPMR